MRAGLLSERIEIQTPTETRSTTGQSIKGWTSLGSFWARVEPLTASETVKAMAAQVIGTHAITTRYNSSITEECRIVYRTKYLNIVSVANVDSKDTELSIVAKEAK